MPKKGRPQESGSDDDDDDESVHTDMLVDDEDDEDEDLVAEEEEEEDLPSGSGRPGGDMMGFRASQPKTGQRGKKGKSSGKEAAKKTKPQNKTSSSSSRPQTDVDRGTTRAGKDAAGGSRAKSNGKRATVEGWTSAELLAMYRERKKREARPAQQSGGPRPSKATKRMLDADGELGEDLDEHPKRRKKSPEEKQRDKEAKVPME